MDQETIVATIGILAFVGVFGMFAWIILDINSDAIYNTETLNKYCESHGWSYEYFMTEHACVMPNGEVTFLHTKKDNGRIVLISDIKGVSVVNK